MVRALAKDIRPGVDLMVLGLTSENVRRLCGGEPILARGDTFGKPDADVLIVFGHTIGDAQSEIVRLGFVWPESTTPPDPEPTGGEKE